MYIFNDLCVINALFLLNYVNKAILSFRGKFTWLYDDWAKTTWEYYQQLAM